MAKRVKTITAAAILAATGGLAGCGAISGDFSAASFSAPEIAREAAKQPSPTQAQVIPEADKLREAVVAHVPFSVSLWLRRGDDRKFMVSRTDRQRMFAGDWSQERAQKAIAAAYTNECGATGALAFQRAVWDPVGVWVVEGSCRSGVTTAALEAPKG